MSTKYLSINELRPPFASGGLWRMWCLLLYASIRHHPPEVFGGANFCCTKRLDNFRHPSTKRIDTVIFYDGGIKKINKNIFHLIATKYRFILYMKEFRYMIVRMIIETIRKHIKACGKTRYRIAKETGVGEDQLCRIMQGRTCTVETADILLKYFGIELKPNKKRGIGFGFEIKKTKVVIGKKKGR